VAGSCEYGDEPSGSVRRGCLQHLGGYKLLKMNSDLCKYFKFQMLVT
jgi:hypothetical protein